MHRSAVRTFLATVAAVACCTRYCTPPVALAVGVVLALLLDRPFGALGHRAAKWLLQGSVVLLGFGMNLPSVLHAGASGAGLAAGMIVATLGLGALLGAALRLNRGTATLISAGTAICGGSAIAAVGSAVDAEEADITVAMGTVFLLNAAALYLFPWVGHRLQLSDRQFGTWAGIGIHDISSVVGAASRFGLGALQTATAVKLSRALWIVPLTLVIAGLQRPRSRPRMANAAFGFDPGQRTPRKLQIPWFIGLFLLASIVRSFVPGVGAAAPRLGQLATVGLTLTLLLIGSSLSVTTLRAVGWRALVQGVALWGFVSVVSLVVILHVAPR